MTDPAPRPCQATGCTRFVVRRQGERLSKYLRRRACCAECIPRLPPMAGPGRGHATRGVVLDRLLAELRADRTLRSVDLAAKHGCTLHLVAKARQMVDNERAERAAERSPSPGIPTARTLAALRDAPAAERVHFDPEFVRHALAELRRSIAAPDPLLTALRGLPMPVSIDPKAKPRAGTP